MKKLITFLSFLFLLIPIALYSEDEPTMCQMDVSQSPLDTIPNYLQPWWNGGRKGYFAVIQTLTKNEINGTVISNVISRTNGNHFSILEQNISGKMKNFNHLNENEKRSLIIGKNILDLAENNYIDGIPSLNDKLQFLNHEKNLTPKVYKLYQNFPNPFNPVTKIKFEIPESEIVKIKIYDLLGREVFTLVSEFKEAGAYELEFNGVNLSSGIYFYKIESGEFAKVKRMVLLK